MGEFLASLGFDPWFIVVGLCCIMMILLILIIIMMVSYSNLNRKLQIFMQNRNGESLEDIIKLVIEDNKRIKAHESLNSKAIEELRGQVQYCYQKYGVVKYNTFRGMSGNLSFALCVLDEKNNGYIMNCMHTQEGCYSYMKYVQEGQVEMALSNEEKDALEKAIQYEGSSNTDESNNRKGKRS